MRVIILAAISLLCGCGTPAEAYVAADRATYAAVAPEYREYVESDPLLTPDQIERRLRTLQVWRIRIQEAEK